MPMTAIRTRLLAPCHANRGLVAATVSATTPFFKSSRRCINLSWDYTFAESTPNPVWHGLRRPAASNRLQASNRRIDLVHESLVFQRAFEAHLRLTARADRRGEIRIHRAVAANVPEAGQDDSRHTLSAHEDDGTVRLERDDAAEAHEFREAQATEERWHFPRIVERADRAVVVGERDEHALGAPIGALTRRSRPETVYRRDARTETPRDVQPVDAFLKERIPSRHGLVIAPVVGGFQPEGDGHEMPEHHVADSIFGQQTPQADGQRLVVIVLADEDGTPGAIALRDNREVVVGVEKCRFLDQHVLACGKRLLRQLAMKSRRAGYDDGVHAA